jgi:25S rRNA (cytosine2870-C5)-methyltransferase
MGRRAKNKQGDPVPFAEVNGAVGSGRPSAKKLGKRKAEFDDDGGKDSAPSKRPQKKVKESESGKGEGKVKDASGKKGASLKTVKSSVAPGTKRRKGAAVEKDEGESSEGWEDVEDDEDLKTQTK